MKYLDVTIDFLECKVNEEIYMTLSKRVILLERHLMVGSGIQVRVRMLKSLYGLKQASLYWFETLENFL